MPRSRVTTARSKASRQRSAGLFPKSTLLFVLPAFIFYGFVLLVPSIRGGVYAFSDWNGLDETLQFVGLKNFKTVLNSASDLHAIKITIIIAAVVTILQTAFGLLLALGVNAHIKSRNVLRVLLFAPAVITPVVAAYLFQYLLAPQGPVNMLLATAGLEQLQQNWLGEPNMALVSIFILMLWRGSGYSMVILLAGLQGISEEVLEAAALDGAGPVRKFWYVVRPLLAPALTISIMLALVQSLTVFGEVWILTAGGPGTATDNLSTSLYKNAFIFGDYAVGITQALILFVLVAAISTFQYRSLLKQERKN